MNQANVAPAGLIILLDIKWYLKHTQSSLILMNDGQI